MKRALLVALIALGCTSAPDGAVVDAGGPVDAPSPDPPFPPFRNDAAIRADAPTVLDTPAGYEVGPCPALAEPPVGFEGAPDLPFTGRVTSVAPDLLIIDVPGRAPVTLHWAGPTLVGPFSVGHTVMAERLPAPYWVELRSPAAHVTFQVARGALAFEAAPAIPFGPALSFFVGCTSADDRLIYTLGVKQGADELTVPPGTTAGFGGLTITNVLSYSHRPGPGSDPGWASIITTLGWNLL